MRSILFDSFWLAGFESAYHINTDGVRVDMIAATQHDRYADEDYRMLPQVGIHAARDACRWYLIDRGGQRYDFSSLEAQVRAALRYGIQVIWTLCHYGWPDDLDFFSAAFVDRFARYARAVARYLREQSDEAPFYSPVNEISFFSWAGARFMLPYASGRDDEIKRQLVRAVIAGTEAVWDVDPRARFVQGEPIVNIVAPLDRPDLAQAAAGYTESQFDAWEGLAGRRWPELGGHPRYLDILGCNFYHDNQWEVLTGDKLWWHVKQRDPRYIPLHELLERVYQRFERPLFIAETSHFGRGRGRWVKDIAQEACRAKRLGVPIEGICLYPILDRHDWEDPKWWHHSGLWDLAPEADGRLRRVLNRMYATGLERAQALLTEDRCAQRVAGHRSASRTGLAPAGGSQSSSRHARRPNPEHK